MPIYHFLVITLTGALLFGGANAMDASRATAIPMDVPLLEGRVERVDLFSKKIQIGRRTYRIPRSSHISWITGAPATRWRLKAGMQVRYVLSDELDKPPVLSEIVIISPQASD